MSGPVGIMFWSCIIYWYVDKIQYFHNGTYSLAQRVVHIISRHVCVLQYEGLRVI